jgi:Ca2+-transporting ATPase
MSGGAPAEGSPAVASTNRGLSEKEAHGRLAVDGPNTLPEPQRRGLARRVREVLTEPLIALLLGATGLYIVFGEPRDAIVLAGSVIVVVLLDIYQESRAERALEALRELALPSAQVFRDGRPRTVPASEIVRGDWVALAEGERVPADGELREGTALLIDESLLTGESTPVRKRTGTEAPLWVRPGGDDLPFVYAQTLVVRGQGWFVVRATGPRTEASRIASALTDVETATPLIRAQIRPLVLGVGGAAVVLTIVLAIVVSLRTGDLVFGLLAGTALAIGLLPEEIPIVTTVYSVLGARRMARRNALVRRFGTIPALGCVTVLCTDKTGTLTENRMRVDCAAAVRSGAIQVARSPFAQEGDVREVIAVAARACEPRPTDPTDIAIQVVARETGAAIPPAARLVEHLPFSPTFRAVRNRWTLDGGGTVVDCKGVPEDLLNTCEVPPKEQRAWELVLNELATSGLRALGVASSEVAPELVDMPTNRVRLRFRGIVGLADPLRPGVTEAVARCRDAGVRVVLITGDHPETARAIARGAGIASDSVLTGDELERLEPGELGPRVGSVNVYARVRPEQKLRLVRALQAQGEIVAMTGDGVNDAPALRASDVGIAMGQRGTDVAREAASLILLDDSFPTVADAIGLGRTVFENMRKALYYVVSVHVALAGMALVPVLLGFPILLFPVEIVFLELVIDPVASLVFEAEPPDSDSMRRSPRDPTEPLLGRSALAASMTLGASVVAAALGIYFAALAYGVPSDQSRAMGFAALMAGNLSMVILCRSTSDAVWRSVTVPNPTAWAVVSFGTALLLSSIYLPPLAAVFEFTAPPPGLFGIAVVLPVAAVMANDRLKRRYLPTLPTRRGRDDTASPSRSVH